MNNSKGQIYYGMHFYPGVAQYDRPGAEPERVYINESTIRKMNPSFAGRPIYVEHVEGVEGKVDDLREEADGWVVESFFNAADGKTWVKFICVSEKAFKAIQNGFKLSNAYLPQLSGTGGLWNGVDYMAEVIGGEYEHLAIVRNPRYEESVIMTPDQFKAYNESNTSELKRLANSKENTMKLNLFKKTKVENSLDLESTSVVLPKSGKEMTLVQLVNEMDVIQNMHGYANGDHLAKVGEEEMSVNDLVKKHMDLCNEMSELKKNKEGEDTEVALDKKPMDVEGDLKNDDDMMENEEDKKDDEKKENAEEDKDKKENEEDDKKKDKKENSKNFEALKNAHLKVNDFTPVIELSHTKLARGKARYGSN